MIEKFYLTLFNPGETICFSPNCYGTEVRSHTKPDDVFFSINPLQNKRCDENVTAHRNFLVEFDSIDVETQREYIAAVKMPFATCVFSGGKSLHSIIALDESLTREAWVDFRIRLYAAVRNIDSSCSNPSRFSRMPGVMRDNGKIQELLEIKRRISKNELNDWLIRMGIGEIISKKFVTQSPSTILLSDAYLNWKTKAFLEYGAPIGSRHHQTMLAAYDLRRIGAKMTQAHDRLCEASGLPEREVFSIIKYVYRGND